ncbi:MULTISPECIES: GntR family transcriptional regulator [Microterricola]|nr:MULTISPECIES: GntR family transcriptional regulator [Microterricola]PPL19460.1 GntR family transcriptional regulator [Microterricola pindariensis]
MVETKISKAEQAYAILSRGIMDGTYGPGQRLVIDQLGREHGISSVPWRESLRRLEAEGWVDIVPNAGAIVKSVDVDSWHRTMNLLARLEGYATALSAPRLDAAELAEARDLNKQMGEALANFDPQRFGDLNRTFHESLCSKSDDERLNHLVHAEWTRLDLIRRTAFWYAPGRALASLAEHDQILDLIEAGADADLIETSVRQHEINTLDAVAKHEAERKAAERARS